MKSQNKRLQSSDTKHWFGRWSNEYDRTLGSIGFHRDLLDLVVESSPARDGARVLDIGCGTGLLSLKFLQAADCYITGVDNSKEMLAVFRDKIKRLRLEKRIVCKLMDATSLEFPAGSFDLAVSSVTLHHIKDKLPALKTANKLLKTGGIFIIGEIDMDSTGKHDDTGRLKRILKVLEEEWAAALKDAGVEAFARMYENGKKHILNQGEYCLSLRQWADLCRRAGFKTAAIKKTARYKSFGVVIAKKG